MGLDSRWIHLSAAGWGISVTVAGQLLRFGLSLVSAAVMARLLLPADFGLVATVAPVIAFGELVRDLGFAQAIVQRRDVTQHQLSALFWLMLGQTALLCLAFFAVSDVIARFYGDARIGPILSVSTVGILFGAMSSLGLAILNRNLKFSTIAVIDILQALTNLAVSATVAATTGSYWALVAGSLAMNALGAVLAIWLSGWVISKPLFDTSVLQMVRFGAGISFGNVLNYISRNADNVLIGKFDGPGALGIYDRAYKLMLLPMWQITYPVSRVLIPTLSRIDNERTYVNTYGRTITFLALVTQPALIALVCNAGATVHIILGDRWSAVAPIFAWLGAASIHQVITSSQGWLYLSQGRARDFAKISAFGAATAVTSFLIGLPWGPVGVAAAYALGDYFLRFPVSWWFVGRKGPVTLHILLKLLLPHVLAALIASAGAIVTSKTLSNEPFIALTASVFISYTFYFIALIFFKAKRNIIFSREL